MESPSVHERLILLCLGIIRFDIFHRRRWDNFRCREGWSSHSPGEHSTAGPSGKGGFFKAGTERDHAQCGVGAVVQGDVPDILLYPVEHIIARYTNADKERPRIVCGRQGICSVELTMCRCPGNVVPYGKPFIGNGAQARPSQVFPCCCA